MPLRSQNPVCRLNTSLKLAIVFENSIQHNEAYKAYNIMRRPAKEVILAIISDLNRGHKDTERHHAIPVAYYISGFSLKMHAATIAIKVIDIGPTESRTTRSGQVMDCKQIIVADSTSSISCCLWEAHFDSIKLAQSYKITNVAVRNFDNIKTLTTCAFEATNDIGPIVESEKKPISVEKIIRIKSAACTAANKCSVCSKDVGNFNSELDTIKCQSCNMRQRTLDITKQYKCEVVAQVDNNNTKLIIPDLVLRGRPDLVLDPNQLETQLLNSVSLTVKLNIGCTHVLDITHIQN
uniref:Uncharacterized protein n=1 Tax=Magallana gigas TaxID=29159 RepID=A0A8W8JXU9_MAGGI